MPEAYAVSVEPFRGGRGGTMTIAEYPLQEESGLNAGDPRDDDIRRQFALEIDRAALANSLDMLSLGIFLVDATGRIIHANVSGRIMLSEATVMRGLGGKGIAVALKARGNARYVANVLPLELGAQGDAGVSGAAVAAVFVHKAVLDLTSLPEVIAKEYGLTPAELRVLFAIIEVGGVGKVAKVLGSSQATVKTHLRHLFKKTGTSRQAELVKLMTTYVCDEVLRGQVVR